MIDLYGPPQQDGGALERLRRIVHKVRQSRFSRPVQNEAEAAFIIVFKDEDDGLCEKAAEHPGGC